jgi:hypothetical protein
MVIAMSRKPNRVLEFLTAPAQANGEASRSNRRRRSSAPVEFSWFQESHWRTTRAKLHDISRGGASLITPEPPPLTRKARLRFIEREGSPWIEAEILEVMPESPGRHRVRIRFEGPCPGFVLMTAVLEEEETPDETPGHRYEWVAVVPEVATEKNGPE